LPTWSCSDLDLARNSTRKRLKCHNDWGHTETKNHFQNIESHTSVK
jgi:hypothetical protein